LEFEYEKRAAELNSNYEFRNISDDILNEEIELLENKLAAMGMKNQLSIDKMLRRHDSSMKNCALRMDSIINAAEGVASQSQVDSMRQTNFDDIILNKRLKEEVAYLKNDITDLRNQLDVLERENMIKASGNLEIEWNLCYDKFENPDYLKLPEIAINLKPIYKKHSSLAKVEAIINREFEERNRDDEFSIRGHKAKIIAAVDLGPANFYSPLRNSKK
jgi:polyhydroxyalkanoate synthesis regulator phasin